MAEARREGDQPIVVTTIATPEAAPLPSGTVATTPDHLPNVVVKVVTPVAMVLVRAAKAFISTLVPLVTVGGPTQLIPAHDFFDLLVKSASLSLGSAVIAALLSIGELLAKLDQKFPSWTA